MSPMKLGHYNSGGTTHPFTIERRNLLVIGAPRTGKTTLLKRLILDDIYNGLPVTFVDPTGNAVDELLTLIPASRQKDVILFDPSRTPFAFNIFNRIENEKHSLYASTLLTTMKGVWGYESVPTPTLDQYLRAIFHTALLVPNSSFQTLKHLLTNDEYRKGQLANITDPVLLDFWTDYETLPAKDKRQETSSTLNKLRAFMFSPDVLNCLEQKDNRLVFKDKIVLCALRTRELGTENASLLGALVLACLFIEDTEQNLYLDGSNFGTAILGQLLTNCPNVNTTIALTFLDQVREEFQPHLLGGVGHTLAFRMSHHDAKQLEPEFNLNLGHVGLTEIAPHVAYFLQDGVTQVIQTIEHDYPPQHQERKIRARCQSQYTAPLQSIEKRIARFHDINNSQRTHKRRSRRTRYDYLSNP